ncbi:MAG: 4Fe-4S cluster-binding domain-containing protein [Oscillospiraceae bacterium]|nr:4Fe-4S cluster-binding domain-containing protein [Oscillospiraceae bacterium]
MSNPYKTRQGGATVTVFVPYDCNNHCPFCINKPEYADCSNFSLARILESIETLDAITPRCDFVFTGGEPFANLESLQTMLDKIPATHKVYINTTFPVQDDKYTAQQMLDFVERNRAKITCINISRHLVKYVEESDDEIIARIVTPKRVNCVLYMDYPKEQLTDYAERWRRHGIPIQFRYDYTETTPENLYDEENDPILRDLKEAFTYRGLDGCRMRNGFHFSYKDLHLTYHKTLPYSTIVETGEDGVTYDILYDVLIKQNGDIHSDWTGVKMDVDKYRAVVYEPYDLRVIDGVIDF